jgi:hypothetical protein
MRDDRDCGAWKSVSTSNLPQAFDQLAARAAG